MNFATKTRLLPHQGPAVVKLLPSRIGAALMDMGTGKSRVLIELARLRAGRFDRLFWLCPCALKETAREQLAIHTDLPSSQVYVWGNTTTADSLPDAYVHIIGIESISGSDRVALAFNAAVTAQSFVVVDESTYIKGHRAIRSQRITGVSARCRYRLIMTGTPYTQGAVDLYSQMSFLSPQILGYQSFWSFAANHLVYEEPRKGERRNLRGPRRIIRTLNEEYLAARIAPYTYQVRKDECLDLPEKIYATRWCEMTDEQSEAYAEAKTEFLETNPDDWSSIAIFRLFTALQSIVCGFWTRRGSLTRLPHNRTALLAAVLDQIPPGRKVIVWAKYHEAVETVVARLGASSCAQFHGGLAAARRDAELRRWRDDADCRYFVATQAAGGHGLTLNEAAYAVFYADSFKYSERIQAEDRNHRIGQATRPTYVTLRCRAKIEDYIASALSRKEDSLTEFRRRVDAIRADGTKERVRSLVESL